MSVLIIELDIDHAVMGTGDALEREVYELLKLAVITINKGPGIRGMRVGDSPVPIMLQHTLVGQAYITERSEH